MTIYRKDSLRCQSRQESRARPHALHAALTLLGLCTLLALASFDLGQASDSPLMSAQAPSSGPLAAQVVEKWSVFEVTLLSSNTHSNPYTDVALRGVFAGPGGVRIEVVGFWDGGNTYKIRFTPTEEGDWSYSISSTPSDTGLTLSGTLRVTAAASNNHGFLRRDPSHPNHFVFDDGTRYYMFGQTYYEAIRNARSGDNWKAAIDHSAAYGMTKVRLLIYPWPHGSNPYPDTQPFVSGSDHDHLNVPHWQTLDQIIRYLADRGLTADIILFADADRVFGTLAQDQRYLRYALARYAAYPNVIWCLTNEWNYTGKDQSYWSGMGDLVREEDPWLQASTGFRPLSIHQQTRHDFQFFDAAFPVHAIIQDGVRNHDPEFVQGDEWGHYGISYNSGHSMPVVNDEFGYIGDQDRSEPQNPDGSYPLLTRAKHRNIIWGIAIAGGYGAAGDIRTFDGSQVIFTSDWHDAEEYGDIQRLIAFWSTRGLPYWEMSPQQAVVASGSRVYAYGEPGRTYIIYTAAGGNFTLALPPGPYKATRYDPRTAQEVALEDVTGGGQQVLSVPIGTDWIVLLMKDTPTFIDVPLTHPYYHEIETLYQAGYTAGCNTDPLMYCPEATMNRAESAVFVERGIHGIDGLPPQPTTQTFADLPLDSWAAKWAEALWVDGYTAGCGTNPLIYCPWQGHTRAEGCVFYLHMLNGPSYVPPQPSQQTFADVPLNAWYAKWVEAAYDAALLTPCQSSPEVRFCPDDPLTRALAAYMMVQAKQLR